MRLVGTSIEKFPSVGWIDGNRYFPVSIEKEERKKVMDAAGIEYSTDLKYMQEEGKEVSVFAVVGSKIRTRRSATEEELDANPNRLYIECEPYKHEVVIDADEDVQDLCQRCPSQDAVREFNELIQAQIDGVNEVSRLEEEKKKLIELIRQRKAAKKKKDEGDKT